jgi:hypothetical protein
MPADRFETPLQERTNGGTEELLIFGIDAHKRTHTIVVVDERGRQVAQRTIKTTTDDHLELVTWADGSTPTGCGLWRTAGTSPAGSSGTF